MSELEIIKEIDLDFLIKKTVFVDAKQGDRNSRYILVSCYSNGSFVNLTPEKHTAFIRYRKKDECISFNKCQITEEGKILVELTQQMLAFPGNCTADLLVMKITKENEDNCESSTMQFYVNVVAMPYNDSDIESTDEFKALSDLMDKALKDYTYVMEHAQESADKAEEEATKATNAATKAQESQIAAANSATASANSASNSASSATASAASAAAALASQNAAKASETAAANSQTAAKTSETNAKASETAAKTSETNAGKSATAAAGSATAAATSAAESSESAENAATSETNAGKSASAAATSEKNAKTSETNATTQATAAKNSATSASTSASTATTKASEAAQSATNAANSAETATRQATSASSSASTATAQADIATKKAKEASNYATKAQSYTEGGTGTRENEDTDNAKNYYEESKKIYDSFVSTGNVTGVKGSAETDYRHGNVNLTPENIGSLALTGGTLTGRVTGMVTNYHFQTTNIFNTGYYKIHINSTADWMLSFTIRIYQNYKDFDLLISGYNYGDLHWYTPTATMIASSVSETITVTFGYDDVGKLWIAIPRGYYTGLDIFNVTTGYRIDAITDFGNLFSIESLDTLTGTTQLTTTVYPPSTQWNGFKLWFGTETEYNAITSKDSKTIYFRHN